MAKKMSKVEMINWIMNELDGELGYFAQEELDKFIKKAVKKELKKLSPKRIVKLINSQGYGVSGYDNKNYEGIAYNWK